MAKKKPVDGLIISGADYEIAKEQLERLKMISKERLLSLEEAKIFDILVKNLKLAKNDPEAFTSEEIRKQQELLGKETKDLLAIATDKVMTIKDLINEHEDK